MTIHRRKPVQACTAARPGAARPCAASRPGIVLVLTVIVLAVLATLSYLLTSRVAQVKHRRRFMIDYQQARYACDSAVKYALVAVQSANRSLADRTDSPDFSDLFAMSEAELAEYRTQWAEYLMQKAAEEGELDPADPSAFGVDEGDGLFNRLSGLLGRGAGSGDPNDPNSFMDPAMDFGTQGLVIDPNDIEIPGPYGPDWPNLVEPIELEIGNARITIAIEDENAKMPLTWAITSDKEAQRAGQDAMVLFCEWMEMEREDMERMLVDLDALAQVKPFTVNPKAITVTEQIEAQTRAASAASRASRLSRSRTSVSRTATRVVRKTRSIEANIADFARLMHSSIVDLEALDRPLPDTGDRYESARRYLGLWGTSQVNINTAPRHVLEAAFTFGGDYVQIADEIIKRRREKPFKSIDELKQALYPYTLSIRKAEPYITTTSDIFSVRVTARCGAATASSVTGIIKTNSQVRKIAVLADR